MAEDIIKMSFKEMERLKIIQKVTDKQVTQVKAAEVLGLSERHVRRIVRRVRHSGERSIVHKRRGQEAANKMSQKLEDRIGEIVRDKYADFGPSLASEKLWESHEIRVGREKLRQIMIERGLWKVRKHRDRYVYPPDRRHDGIRNDPNPFRRFEYRDRGPARKLVEGRRGNTSSRGKAAGKESQSGEP